MTQRRPAGDHAACGRAHDVSAMQAELIDELDQIERESFVRESRIRSGVRLAVPANIRTHDAKLTRKMRHPSEKPQGAAEPGMEQHDERRFAPRVREVVVQIM